MKKLFVIAPVLVLILAFSTRNAASFPAKGGTRLTAELSGAAERPGPGDPDGSGWVELRLNQGQGTISYEIHVMNIAEASAAHIHIGSPSVAGPVVVGLEPPSDGSISGEVQVDEELIKAMRKNPGNYYVNVHNGRIPQALSGGN